MGGSVSFQKALSDRLSIIRCSREQVNKLITDHPPQLTPGVKLVSSLSSGKMFLNCLFYRFGCFTLYCQIISYILNQ